MIKPSRLRLHARPPIGGCCCHCDEPLDSDDLAAFSPGLRCGGWAHLTCVAGPNTLRADDAFVGQDGNGGHEKEKN